MTLAASRATRVIRLHLVNRWATIAFPFIVLGAIFVMTYALWVVLDVFVGDRRANVGEVLQYSGASTWIFVYMFVVAVQAITTTFPLALGFGSTRRNFIVGTAATFVALSLMWAVALTALSIIETATNGWGVGGRMFSSIYFGGSTASAPERFVIFLCLTLFSFLFGSAGAAVWMRWRAAGLTAFFLALGAVLLGAIALIALTRAWDAVGGIVGAGGALGIALWLLVPTAVSAAVGFLVLRRATPRG